jgi:hypothetical protein
MSYIGNPINSVAFLTDQFSGNGSTVNFTMSVAPANTASILVAISGVVQNPSTYAVVGTTLTFSAAPPSGTGNISVRYLGIPASGVTTTAYRTYTEYTATNGQTSFSTPSYTPGFLNVYRNGVLLGLADYTATTGTTVVLAVGAAAGDLITTESFYVSSVLNAIANTNGSVTQLNLAPNVAGNGPAFSAYLGVQQNLTTSTFTKCQYAVEEFDTANCYNNTGSTVGSVPAYAFMPNVSGYYQVNAMINGGASGAAPARSFAAIYKNGVETKRGNDFSGTNSNGGASISAVIYMNGSTDYLELYAYINATSPAISQTNSGSMAFFQANLVRAA